MYLLAAVCLYTYWFENLCIMYFPGHLPLDCFVSEIPLNTVNSNNLAMAMPFHLHAHYANAYTHPAFLFSFGAPPLGPVGFPYVPQAALMESRPVRTKPTKNHFPDQLKYV